MFSIKKFLEEVIMDSFAIRNPSAFIARGIENLVIKEENSSYIAVKIGYGVLSRLISVTVFPVFLTLELLFKHIPKLLVSISLCPSQSEAASREFDKRVTVIHKFCLGILCSPLGLRAADGISGLFLKNHVSKTEVRPFGVEEQYGKQAEAIYYPESVEELQGLVRKAKAEGKKISVVGAGMSQGLQTIPSDLHDFVINTKKLRRMEFGEDNNTVKVQSGATWEQVQIGANERGKSVIVKQASDIFSIGGSIGINCHGWAHEYGAIASTVDSLEVIDANGDLRTLTPQDELFGCMFGTLGYFGIVVSATLKLTDNEYLIENTKEVELSEFIDSYKGSVKGKGIPLFGGRLNLDNLEGEPLQKVCMVSYEKDVSHENVEHAPLVTNHFYAEPTFGTRIERIALQALSHLSYFTTRRLIGKFWERERELMFAKRRMTRNEALHPPIKAFKFLHKSNLHAQWLQEYFIKEENLPNFLRFLGAKLKSNDVRLINATIRPTPKDSISILPYAEQDRYAVVICFSQLKTEEEIQKTKDWITVVNNYVVDQGDIYYQAYMPYATKELFEKCYGKEQIQKMRLLKEKYDPNHIFSNEHTKKYFDSNPSEET